MHETENGKKNLRVATNFFSVPKMFSVIPIFLTCIFGTTNFLVRKSGVQKFFSLCLKLKGENFSMPNFSRQKIKIFGVYETGNGEIFLTTATNFFHLAENVQWNANFFDVHFWHDKFLERFLVRKSGAKLC